MSSPISISGSGTMHLSVIIHCNLRLIVFLGYIYSYSHAPSCSQPQCSKALFHKPRHLALHTAVLGSEPWAMDASALLLIRGSRLSQLKRDYLITGQIHCFWQDEHLVHATIRTRVALDLGRLLQWWSCSGCCDCPALLPTEPAGYIKCPLTSRLPLQTWFAY